MLHKFLVATVATVIFGGVASAADMPARMATKAVPYVQMYNWTGFYIGANIGYGWSRSSDDLGLLGNANGVIGGGQIGYNWQMNNIVLGLEADFQGSGQKASATGLVGPVAVTLSERIRYFGTVRARVGYAFDRTLLYVTGGYAYTNVASDVTATLGLVSATASSNTTKSGATVGAGLEYAFAGPWTGKIEYLYVDSGTQSATILGVTENVRIRNHIGRVGINYRF
jgi:outer membrane immunogenic protein